MADSERADYMGQKMDTADQLEAGPTENKHALGTPGQDFHGESDVAFASVAPVRREHGEPGHPGSGWTFEKYRD